MQIFKVFILPLLALLVRSETYVTDTQDSSLNGYGFEMMDLLGLGERPIRMKRQPSLRNAASKFLLEVYNEISEHEAEQPLHPVDTRHKRSIDGSDFITNFDRMEIDKCNNIITFSSRESRFSQQTTLPTVTPVVSDMLINFNTNDVPQDLQLAHSGLRLFQMPSHGSYAHKPVANVTISIYRRVYSNKPNGREFHIITSLNTTTKHRGWLEFNMTRLMGRWLEHKTLQQVAYGNDILVGASLIDTANDVAEDVQPSQLGIVGVSSEGAEDTLDLQPFLIGYFNGPELMAKIQKLRFKRDVIKRKRKVDPMMANPYHSPYRHRQPPPPMQDIYKLPKTCERLNFTLDFKDLQMHNWVIAPKKFEAYFCGGECNFPLGSKMNATNHAIVQTLMHLKKPNLPKPCCVPTVLGSISILHYINEDSVNLSKYPQSVAKECGCH